MKIAALIARRLSVYAIKNVNVVVPLPLLAPLSALPLNGLRLDKRQSIVRIPNASMQDARRPNERPKSVRVVVTKNVVACVRKFPILIAGRKSAPLRRRQNVLSAINNVQRSNKQLKHAKHNNGLPNNGPVRSGPNAPPKSKPSVRSNNSNARPKSRPNVPSNSGLRKSRRAPSSNNSGLRKNRLNALLNRRNGLPSNAPNDHKPGGLNGAILAAVDVLKRSVAAVAIRIKAGRAGGYTDVYDASDDPPPCCLTRLFTRLKD